MTPKKTPDPARGARLRAMGRRLGAAAAALAASFFFHQGLLGAGGLTDLWRLRAAAAEREARVERLRTENRALEEKARLLNSDRAFQEREVRERLGYVRADEVVYRESGD